MLFTRQRGSKSQSVSIIIAFVGGAIFIHIVAGTSADDVFVLTVPPMQTLMCV